jgi:hypothetical protein
LLNFRNISKLITTRKWNNIFIYWHSASSITIFTLCRMITWVIFLRMFWNFISSLPVKRGGSLSFLVGTISNVLVMEIGWTDVGSGGYILVVEF